MEIIRELALLTAAVATVFTACFVAGQAVIYMAALLERLIA